ncbi:o-succinylbenzoate--CoA ligase [Weissella minor]|uniref:o-succinylbenzoate--CoA ligase n=1 Tax=Weissella minor TaxID=1620 RepID=UPI003AF3024A
MQNWLTKRVDLTPERTAITYAGQQLSFLQLSQAVEKLAQQLANKLDDNPRVAILTTNTLTGYEMILALQQLGRTVVLLNYRLAPTEIGYQLNDADVTQVLQTDSYTESLSHVQQLTFSEITAAPLAHVEFQSNFDLDQVTTIMYTSGTTGKPKGVEQTFGNHFYSAVGSALNLGLSADDAWVAAVPIFHISGLSIMMRSLIYGMEVRLYERFDVEQINADIMNGKVTTISVVPTMLKSLLNELPVGATYPSRFKTMLLGGGPSDLATLNKAQLAGVGVVQSYGMTETASQIIALDPKDALPKMGSVGKALFPVELRVAHMTTEGVGRVQVKSPTLTVGYLNKMDKYEASFEDGWFDTGDMGYQDAEGYLYLVGREGDMISSGGENIFPNEIEDVYQQLPEIKEISVIGVSDEHWGAVPVAVIEFNQGQELTHQALVHFGRQHLAHYKVPKTYYRLTNDWPRTASGKIQRYLLQKNTNLDDKIL